MLDDCSVDSFDVLVNAPFGPGETKPFENLNLSSEVDLVHFLNKGTLCSTLMAKRILIIPRLFYKLHLRPGVIPIFIRSMDNTVHFSDELIYFTSMVLTYFPEIITKPLKIGETTHRLYPIQAVRELARLVEGAFDAKLIRQYLEAALYGFRDPLWFCTVDLCFYFRKLHLLEGLPHLDGPPFALASSSCLQPLLLRCLNNRCFKSFFDFFDKRTEDMKELSESIAESHMNDLICTGDLLAIENFRLTVLDNGFNIAVNDWKFPFKLVQRAIAGDWRFIMVFIEMNPERMLMAKSAWTIFFDPAREYCLNFIRMLLQGVTKSVRHRKHK